MKKLFPSHIINMSFTTALVINYCLPKETGRSSRCQMIVSIRGNLELTPRE